MSYWKGLMFAAAIDLVWIMGCPLLVTEPEPPALVEPVGRGFQLTLDRPAYGVAPGQAAVLYEDDVVVGAGLIASAA